MIANPEHVEQITQRLRGMPEDVRLMVLFGLARATEDQQTAASAGHGYSRIPLTHDKDDRKHRWTLLREDNVRLSHDYRFLDAFDPEAMEEDLERKIDLLLEGDLGVVRLLVQQWKDRKGFDPDWLLERPNGREYAERHEAIHVAVARWWTQALNGGGV